MDSVGFRMSVLALLAVVDTNNAPRMNPREIQNQRWRGIVWGLLFFFRALSFLLLSGDTHPCHRRRCPSQHLCKNQPSPPPLPGATRTAAQGPAGVQPHINKAPTDFWRAPHLSSVAGFHCSCPDLKRHLPRRASPPPQASTPLSPTARCRPFRCASFPSRATHPAHPPSFYQSPQQLASKQPLLPSLSPTPPPSPFSCHHG